MSEKTQIRTIRCWFAIQCPLIKDKCDDSISFIEEIPERVFR